MVGLRICTRDFKLCQLGATVAFGTVYVSEDEGTQILPPDITFCLGITLPLKKK
jgi:hypothetical protein